MPWVVEFYPQGQPKHAAEFSDGAAARSLFDRFHKAKSKSVMFSDERGIDFIMPVEGTTCILLPASFVEQLVRAQGGQPPGGLVLGGGGTTH